MRARTFIFLVVVGAPVCLPGATAQTLGGCVEDLSLTADHDAAIITLDWSATVSATSYEVHRSLDGNAPALIATVLAPATSYVDSPAPGGILEYRVGADGPPSTECPAVQAHIGGEPPPHEEPVCISDLTASADASEVTLSWPALAGAASYDVLRGASGAALVPYAVVAADQTSFLDPAVDPGVTYRYSVVANGLPPEGVTCEVVEVTTVAFFSAIGQILIAAGLVALGYAGISRWRRS